jgi:glycosyltransferase involved in cell wall biosynthesis
MMLESDGPGGAEYMLIQLSEELRRRGHTVIPVGPAHGVGWLERVFREKGFETEKFTLNRPIDFGCLRGIVAMLRRQRIDLVHSHEFTMAVYGAAAARIARTPYVITMHGGLQRLEAALRRRVALRWALQGSTAAVAVSNAVRTHLARTLALEPDRLVTVYNGTPPRAGSGERIRRELGARADEVLLLAVGNLYPIKGHLILFEALAQLDAAGVQAWRVAIAGRGREKPEFQRVVRELGIADRVHLLGHRDDVPDLLAAADVFAMPSLVEGFPLALLEAMYAGKPIVASAVGGIPEAIKAGEQGLLTPPGDPAALAEALGRLVKDPGLRERLGIAARRRAEEAFTIERMADCYERLYAGGTRDNG